MDKSAAGGVSNPDIISFLDDIRSVQKQLQRLQMDSDMYPFCFLDEDRTELVTLRKSLIKLESNFKSDVNNLSNFRHPHLKRISRAMDPTALLRKYQEDEEASPEKILSVLKSARWAGLKEKLNLAKEVATVSGGGAYYLRLEDIIAGRRKSSGKDSDEFEARFYFTRRSAVEAPEEWEENKGLFLNGCRDKPENSVQCIAVDCDATPNDAPLPASKFSVIQMSAGGHLIADDYAEALRKGWNIPGLNEDLSNFKENLRSGSTTVTVDLGETPSTSTATRSKYERSVSYPTHTKPSKTVPSQTSLDHHFQVDRQELNVLILGETGVGKSTWINMFQNFLHYETLEQAEASKLHTLIPTKFSFFDENFKPVEICTGDDENEVLEAGQSATQEARIHQFKIANTTVRLIDTPGIGDVRGLDQDQLNFKNILDTVGKLHEIHGICVLLKPNNAKLNVTFRFCIKELLANLDKDASKNIVFCFTNSKGTNFKPGDTFNALSALLSGHKDVRIPLGRETLYCFDSEPYRYLAGLQHTPPVRFSEDERSGFQKSWNRSLDETKRMLEHFQNVEPHPVKSMISLNNARAMVLRLARPMAEVSTSIQANKIIVETEREMIRESAEKIQELEKHLKVLRSEIETVKLDYPKLVCSNSNCVGKKEQTKKKLMGNYRICQDKCIIKSLNEDTVGLGDVLKKHLGGNSVGDACEFCGHNLKDHLHIFYDSKEVVKQVEDEATRNILNQNLSDKEKKEKIIESRNRLIEEYETEFQAMCDASVRFAYFTKMNSILVYNDGLEGYLEYLIHEERNKVGEGSAEMLRALERRLDQYREDKQTLEQAIKMRGEVGFQVSPEDIVTKITELRSLKHAGKGLERAMECIVETAENVHASHVVKEHEVLEGDMQGEPEPDEGGSKVEILEGSANLKTKEPLKRVSRRRRLTGKVSTLMKMFEAGVDGE